MDIMSFFVIRTAVPFGYLVIYLGLLGVAVFGLVQVWRGVRARPLRRGRALAGVALLAGVTLIIAANSAYDAALDLNPRVTTADLIGA
jgi:hypothetical protein